MTNELELIPLLWRHAMEERLSPWRMRRRLDRARTELSTRRARVEGLGEAWSRQALTRGELTLLHDLVSEGRREVEHLDKCLAHLYRWAADGSVEHLRRAQLAYDTAGRCWKRHLKVALELAPAMSCREYRA